MEGKRCIQGRWLEPEEIDGLGQWIEAHQGRSRKALAKGLCELWNWRNGQGRLKDFAARSLLLKLAAEGRIQLPPLQLHQRRERRKVEKLSDWQEPTSRQEDLGALRPLKVLKIETGTAEWGRWAFYLDQYHYLGLRIVGENLGYLIQDVHLGDVACLLFGAAAWKCAVRDQFLGWKERDRREQLSRLANNTRFLILPWVRVKHLASHVLGIVTGRIQSDWRQKYGHGLDWLESFVDSQRFSGGCYAAANWQCVGKTLGRGRQDRRHERALSSKKVFLFRLHR